MRSFKDLGLRTELVQALDGLGFERPTAIQDQAIPQALEGGDLIALARTGTGKTAAFSLPILHRIDTAARTVQCIVLCPTRELCLQITKDMQAFATHMQVRTVAVYGGAGMDTQIRGIKGGAQVVIGTPGRTVDLINRGALRLGDVKFLVLDEADEMLNMGFKDDLDTILNETPRERQTLLFSATMPPEIRSIAKNYMNTPAEVRVESSSTDTSKIEHIYYQVSARDKYEVLKRVADLHPDIYGIVFCRTRRETQEIADRLMADGYNADTLHGDLSQAQRDSIMGRFRSRHLQMLVATDVAARGLDVNDLTHVINYSLPDEAEVYVHRSGRTGRAGKQGISIAIVHGKEKGRLRQIEKLLNAQFQRGEVPSGREICEKKLFTIVDRISRTEVRHGEIERFLPAVYEQLAHLSREELIQKLVMHEFSTFLNYYRNARDLNAPDTKERVRDMDTRFARIRIGLGKKDGMSPAQLIGFINDHLSSKDAQIGRIDMTPSFSVVEIDARYADELKSKMDGAERNGRSVFVQDDHSKPGPRKEQGYRKEQGGQKERQPWERTERTGTRPRSQKPDTDRDAKPNPREDSGWQGRPEQRDAEHIRQREQGPAGENEGRFRKRFELRATAPPFVKKNKSGFPASSKFKGKPKRK